MEEVAFAHNIETRLQDQLGAMQLISSRHTYPLVATWAKQFVGPGFALVGDAAVGMHPITAHGFNLGLSSVCRLAHAVGLSLTKYGRVAHPNALARYQRHHRAHAWPLFVGTGAIVGLYTNDHALAQPLRHAIITGMRWLPPLRDTLAAAVTDAAPPEKVLGLLRGIARSSGNATVS
jgi:2-polyprenyl-6-methoxyphenol hydroxylase-like FAD-dependent oxidoreductase